MSKKKNRPTETPEGLAAERALCAADRALDAENARGRGLRCDAARLLSGIASLGVATVLATVPSVAALAPEWPAIAVLGVMAAALLCLLAAAILCVVSGMGSSAPAVANPSEVLNAAGLAFTSKTQLAAHVVAAQKSLAAQAKAAGMGSSAPAVANPSEVLNAAGLAFTSKTQLAAHVVAAQKSLAAQAKAAHDAQEGALRTVRILMLVALGLLCVGVVLVLVLLILAMVL